MVTDKATGLVLVTLMILGMAACQSETEVQVDDIRPVRTQVVSVGQLVDSQQAVGEIRPRFESSLSFRVAGKIIARHVDVGDRVKQGKVLAEIDNTDYRGDLQAARANLEAAQARQREAKSSESRIKQLLGQKYVTQSEYDKASSALSSANAQVRIAQSSFNIKQDQLAYTKLVADADGIITQRRAEAGQNISAGTVVFTLAKSSAKDAVFSLSEEAIIHKPENSPTIEVSLLADPSIATQGVVREISPVADTATRTFTVKIALDNAPEQMYFGAGVIGKLDVTEPNVVSIPLSAIYDRDGEAAVWLYQRPSSTVSLVAVGVARYEHDIAVLSNGLQSGDIVVTAGVNRLREGQKVKLLDATQIAPADKSQPLAQ